MTPALLAGLLRARRDGRPVVLATRLADGAQYLLANRTARFALANVPLANVPLADVPSANLPSADAPLAGALDSRLVDAAARALAEDCCLTVRIGDADWFLHPHTPAPRLIVVGAVHIAQALVPFAAGCGFVLTVVDPRRTFASGARFPQVAISTAWPDEALDALAPDSRTAVVTLTHDPKLDDPALDRALASPAFYIGALGSRRTHAARLQRLRALGHDAAALARIHGPVGLPIAAVTAPEIAVAIMAQIIAVRRATPAPVLATAVVTAPDTAPPVRSTGALSAQTGSGQQVAAVVLAAGRSVRMAPHNKLLVADRAGTPMIARVVDQVLASAARPVIVVMGHQSAAIERALAGRPVQFVYAAGYADGQSASLKAGIGAVPAGCAAAVVCLGDMPLVTGAMIDRLLAAYDPGAGQSIVRPVWQGVPGNPVVWDRGYFAEIGRLTGDRGARHLLGTHAASVLEVAMKDDAVLRDFDTLDALADQLAP